MRNLAVLALLGALTAAASANLVYFDLSTADFSQDWSNTSLITTDDDWSGVGSIMGHRGDNGAQSTNTDPQTLLLDLSGVVDVNANRNDTDTFGTGGVAEFDGISNPTVALNGSGTADAPNLVFYMNAAGRKDVTVSYLLRDLDGSVDNSTQQFALQYRIGNSGNFTNVPSGYVADASGGPSEATKTTAVSVSLAAWDNVSQLEFRVMTTNAGGNDEWVGVDDISVTSHPVPEPASLSALALGGLLIAYRRRKV